MSADSTKTFPVFHLNLFSDANTFVSCWSKLYNYQNYERYKSIITKPELEKGDLRVLFEWKNGMNLSAKKDQSFLNQILQHEILIQQLRLEFDEGRFDETFGKMSAIWQLYLRHIIQPSVYPIFDQHVYRAYRFIQQQEDKDLPFTRTTKLGAFYKEYYPFFLDMKDLADEHDHFVIDKALWSFGKIIKEYPGLTKFEVNINYRSC
jgi:hypothetical protein